MIKSIKYHYDHIIINVDNLSINIDKEDVLKIYNFYSQPFYKDKSLYMGYHMFQLHKNFMIYYCDSNINNPTKIDISEINIRRLTFFI